MGMMMHKVKVDTDVVYSLTAADRCDVRDCGAQAYIRVVMDMDRAELLFCAHHGREVAAKIEQTAIAWVDETSRLDSV